MLLARLLAFLALILLAPVAQAGPGEVQPDQHLLESDALVEAISRKSERATGEGDDPQESLPARFAQIHWSIGPPGLRPVAFRQCKCAGRLNAQPRAPPLRKV